MTVNSRFGLKQLVVVWRRASGEIGVGARIRARMAESDPVRRFPHNHYPVADVVAVAPRILILDLPLRCDVAVLVLAGVV